MIDFISLLDLLILF